MSIYEYIWAAEFKTLCVTKVFNIICRMLLHQILKAGVPNRPQTLKVREGPSSSLVTWFSLYEFNRVQISLVKSGLH